MTYNGRNSEDLRVKRTQQLIMDAMIELTARKGFSSVTVRDIAEFAGINRATFYRHYQDKFDLLDEYARALYELSEMPADAGPQARGGGAGRQTAPGMVRMFEHIQAHARFYRVMLGKNGDPRFSEKIRQYMEKRIRAALPEPQRSQETSLDLYLSYISGGSLGGLIWWLEHEMPYSPEEMAAISHRLNSANLNAMFGQAQPAAHSKAKNGGKGKRDVASRGTPFEREKT